MIHNTISEMEIAKSEFLPPNTTPDFNHLITASFKVKYRHHMVKRILFEMEDGISPSNVNFLPAILTDKVWSNVSSSKIIVLERLDSLLILEVVRQLTSINLIKTASKMI